MAGSPTPRLPAAESGRGTLSADPRANLPALIRAALEQFHPGLPLGIALSGGADSTALLVVSVRRWPGKVHAIHIHHGLQPAAQAFADHCQALCAALAVPLLVRHVDARAKPGESPEDAARRARYESFCRIPTEEWSFNAIKDIALGHQLDDQAETVLLALLRGGGLPGLSAMPPCWTRDGIRFHRPLLGVPGAQLRQWLQSEGIPWVEDPTNGDPRFTRNRIRLNVSPALDTAFPHFRKTLARSARHAAQAVRLLDQLAAQDLVVTGDPPHIRAVQKFSTDRQANLLRYWLKTRYGQSPTESQMVQLQVQVAACTTRGHRIQLKVGAGRLQRDGEILRWDPEVAFGA